MVANAGGKVQGEIRSTSIKRAINLALRFAFLGQVQSNGKVFKSWNLLRASLEEDIVKDHLSLLSAIADLDVDNTPGHDLADKVIEILNVSDDGHCGATASISHGSPELFHLLTAENAAAAVSFLDKNSAKFPADFCTSYQDCSRNIAAEINNLPSPAPFTKVMELMMEHMFDVVPAFMREIATSTARIMAQDSECGHG